MSKADVVQSILVIAMAILASVITIFPPSNMTTKMVWAICFILIGVGELITVRWQYNLSKDKETAQNEANQKTIHSIISAYKPPITEDGAIYDLRFSIDKLVEKMATSKPSVVNEKERKLKRELLQTSSELFAFMAERGDGPPIPLGRQTLQEFNDYTSLMIAFSNETMRQYNSRFQAQVIYLHDELANIGFHDARFDSFYKSPTNKIRLELHCIILGGFRKENIGLNFTL